ncbi:MAG TPA: ROK family protein [Bacilli bacterium]
MAVIGVDVGGTKVKAGIINRSGEIGSLIQENTDKASTMEQIINMIRKLQFLNPDIEAIGIGTAGRVDYEKGAIYYATSNLPGWTGTPVKDILQKEFNRPIVVDNDGNTAAYAEGCVGAAMYLENYICITLGTGVGAGMVVDGSLVRGTMGGAGEVGHMILFPNGKSCNCGKRGCWEQYVSGTALQQIIDNDVDLSILANNPENLFKLSRQTESWKIRKVVDDYIFHLAVGLTNLQRIFEPDCIVIGGGILDSSFAWWDKLATEVTNYESSIRIEKAQLKNNAGLIGAGLLAYREISL